MGTVLDVFIGPPNGFEYRPGEGNQDGIYVGTEEDNPKGRNNGRGGAIQRGYLAPMWTNILWKRLCCYYGEVMGITARITADEEIIRWIGTTLITRVGGVVAISKVG